MINGIKRVWPWFQSLSRSRQIGVCVALTHLGVIAVLLINHATSSPPKAKAPITVRTTLIPRKEISIAAPSQAVKQTPVQASKLAPKAAQPQPERKAAPTPLEKKPAAPQKAQIQTKNAAMPTIQKKNEWVARRDPGPVGAGSSELSDGSQQGTCRSLAERKISFHQEGVLQSPTKGSKSPENTGDSSLFKELADSLEALAAPTHQTAARSKFPISLPQSIEISTPVALSSFSSDASEYGEIVLAILQNSLDLPEFGEVVARIEIDAYGAVVSCEILEERSRKNGQFLKNRLQELAFPCFNEFGLSEKRLNFTVTFRNAENR